MRTFGTWLHISLLTLALSLCGCAGSMSLPGGTEDVNSSSYKTPDDLLMRVDTMQPGITEQAVFSKLGRNPSDLTRLQRNDILTALYGSSSVEFRNGQIGTDAQSVFLQSLYGYELEFKDVKKELGFTSPWRIRTDEGGYDYKVVFIFQNGVLYQHPIVTGGLVKKSSSRTLFEYLTPSAIMHMAE